MQPASSRIPSCLRGIAPTSLPPIRNPGGAFGPLNTASTKISTCSAERQLSFSRTRAKALPALAAISANAVVSWATRSGAAPWNEKIDCFSSPTANIVR